MKPGAQQRSKDLLPDEAQEPREKSQPGDEAGRAPLGPLPALGHVLSGFLDLSAQTL
jgi:hypothetical protein